MLPRGTTGPWVEQTAESEQDSESKTPSAVTQRGKTPSVTRGLLPSAQRGQSPHHPGPRDGGCVSHSVTGRSLSVTDISERPHLGTHSPPISGLPLGVRLGRTSVVASLGMGTATAQSVPWAALPCPALWGCHPPLGQRHQAGIRVCPEPPAAAPSPGAGSGVHPRARGAGRSWNCPFPARTSRSRATRDPVPRGDHGERGDEQSHKFLFCHPGAHGGTSRGWETPGGKTGGESRGDTSNLTPSRVAEGCTPAPRGPGSWGRCQGQCPEEGAPGQLPGV